MTPEIIIIAAVAADGGIGREGQLLYHLRPDMQRFRRLTTGHTIIMGRRTFESLPGVLPQRRHIVLSRNDAYRPDGAETAASLEEAIGMCRGEEEVFIIGGAAVYADAMPLASRLEITRIDASNPQADTFFPPIDSAAWHVAACPPARDPATGLSYSFVTYSKE
ncbi:MAG: dihydrofolate reductase [Muribaculaceae bacterium]|nr:dihydrofolate reductase [Muribaculaceae bacterium]